MTNPQGSDVYRSVLARIDRAEEHRLSIQRDRLTLQEKGGPGRIEANAEQTILKVFLEYPETDWAIRVSDALHQLRASLDNLAWGLHITRSGVPNAAAAKQIAFPIYTDPDEFNKRGEANIAGIHPDAAALIRRLQPYRRGDRRYWAALAMLSELNNRDKHRQSHLAMLQLGGIEITYPTALPIKDKWATDDDGAENGALLAWVEFAQPMQRGMKVNFQVGGHVGINYTWAEGKGKTATDSTVRTPLDSTLVALSRRVRRIAGLLRPYL